MAESMRKIVRRCFPNAIRVIDRFHVQKLACDALQEIRIEHRWDAINEETNAIEEAKLSNKNTFRKLFAAAIQKNNSLHEVVTCYSNLPKNGQTNKSSTLNCFLNFIPISGKQIF